MTESTRQRLVRRKKVRFYGGRGPLYSWLRTHHDEIQSLRGRHLNLWAALVLDMAEDGVATLGDGPGLRDRTRHAWRRVERDVESESKVAKGKPSGGNFPSRISPDWRPQTVVPPPPIRAPPPGPVPIPSSATAVTNPAATDKSREGLESLDRAFALLEADDRRKFRFGG